MSQTGDQITRYVLAFGFGVPAFALLRLIYKGTVDRVKTDPAADRYKTRRHLWRRKVLGAGLVAGTFDGGRVVPGLLDPLNHDPNKVALAGEVGPRRLIDKVANAVADDRDLAANALASAAMDNVQEVASWGDPVQNFIQFNRESEQLYLALLSKYPDGNVPQQVWVALRDHRRIVQETFEALTDAGLQPPGLRTDVAPSGAISGLKVFGLRGGAATFAVAAATALATALGHPEYAWFGPPTIMATAVSAMWMTRIKKLVARDNLRGLIYQMPERHDDAEELRDRIEARLRGRPPATKPKKRRSTKKRWRPTAYPYFERAVPTAILSTLTALYPYLSVVEIHELGNAWLTALISAPFAGAWYFTRENRSSVDNAAKYERTLNEALAIHNVPRSDLEILERLQRLNAGMAGCQHGTALHSRLRKELVFSSKPGDEVGQRLASRGRPDLIRRFAQIRDAFNDPERFVSYLQQLCPDSGDAGKRADAFQRAFEMDQITIAGAMYAWKNADENLSSYAQFSNYFPEPEKACTPENEDFLKLAREIVDFPFANDVEGMFTAVALRAAGIDTGHVRELPARFRLASHLIQHDFQRLMQGMPAAALIGEPWSYGDERSRRQAEAALRAALRNREYRSRYSSDLYLRCDAALALAGGDAHPNSLSHSQVSPPLISILSIKSVPLPKYELPLWIRLSELSTAEGAGSALDGAEVLRGNEDVLRDLLGQLADSIRFTNQNSELTQAAINNQLVKEQRLHISHLLRDQQTTFAGRQQTDGSLHVTASRRYIDYEKKCVIRICPIPFMHYPDQLEMAIMSFNTSPITNDKKTRRGERNKLSRGNQYRPEGKSQPHVSVVSAA